MNILLIGEYFSDNLGDGVICQVTEEIIKHNYKTDVNIIKFDISGRKSYINMENTKKSIIESMKSKATIFYGACIFLYRIFGFPYDYGRASKIVKDIRSKEINIAIFAGGQMFMDFFTIPVYAIVKELNKRNIPVVFNS